MDPMHPSVKYGSSMRAIGVPKRSSFGSYSHIARPQPRSRPTDSIVSMICRYSG